MLPEVIAAILPDKIIEYEASLFGASKSPDEIRLRSGLGAEFITENSVLPCNYIPGTNEVYAVINSAAGQSLFSHEKELAAGYITLTGGHRIGFTGRISESNGKTVTDNFGGVNIRIARQVKGCSEEIIKLFTYQGRLRSGIIASPPGGGKTTLLRDIARKISEGTGGVKSMKVGIVDERGELAAVKNGIPQLDVGRRTDVADGCSKSTGINMLIRSMSPEVIITDEIGGSEDFEAVLNASRSGVKVITSAHAYDIDDFKSKYHLKQMLESSLFEVYVFPMRINNRFDNYKAYSNTFAEIKR